MKKLIGLAMIFCIVFFSIAAYAENAEILTPREIIGLDAEASPDWVAALAEKLEAEQLFVVAAYEKTTAWVSLHEKDETGAWKMTMSTPGYIGRNGLGKIKEGDGMTPVGVFSFNRAFGIAADPGCAIPYVQADENTCWSGDGREGMRYNELISLTDYPDLNLEDSEHILDYTYQYQYCLNISYNAEGTPGLGSAIFLHCTGDRKPYTGGCVAIPMAQMYFVMRHVSPDCVVVIDTLENLEAAADGKNEAALPVSDEAEAEADVQYVLYLGTNDKDTDKPVFTQMEAKQKAKEILISYFGGYTIQEAEGGWIGDDGTVYQEYTLVIYLSDTTLDRVHEAADALVEAFRQSSVLIQTNPTATEFYSGK